MNCMSRVINVPKQLHRIRHNSVCIFLMKTVLYLYKLNDGMFYSSAASAPTSSPWFTIFPTMFVNSKPWDGNSSLGP